ncbi:MAG: hypothetical protein AB7R89_24335 [Dehalococcoidia bacterium]
MDPGTLVFDRLHERHPGVTEAVGRNYAEAAAICFNRYHSSPSNVTVTADATHDKVYFATWTKPSARQEAAWANRDDATRDGAYCIVLAAADQHLNLVAVARAATKSGADYLVGPPGGGINPLDGELDFESEILRLEISGIDRCENASRLRARVAGKVEQARSGRSDLPALAGVVAFDLARVLFKYA